MAERRMAGLSTNAVADGCEDTEIKTRHKTRTGPKLLGTWEKVRRRQGPKTVIQATWKR